MKLTQGAIDLIQNPQSIPLIVQIQNVSEFQQFESFNLQKCQITDGIKTTDIYLMVSECLNQKQVQNQKIIIKIEDFKSQSGFIIVGKYEQISQILDQKQDVQFIEEPQDLKELQVTKFSDLVKGNYYNIQATIHDISQKKSTKGNQDPYIISKLYDSLSQQEIKCLILINDTGEDLFFQFKNKLEEGLEFVFINVKIDTYQNEKRVYLNSNTKIKIVPTSIKWSKFKDIDQQFGMIEESCNLILYIYQIKPLLQISSKYQIKKIYAFDMNFDKVLIVVWNQSLINNNLQEGTIIAFQNLVIKEYQNKFRLLLNHKTKIITNSENLVQVENYNQFKTKIHEQIDEIDKRSNFYRMKISSLKMIFEEFQQVTSLIFVKYYRIKVQIVSFQEIDTIKILNRQLQIIFELQDNFFDRFYLKVNRSKFIREILNLSEHDIKGWRENILKIDKLQSLLEKNKIFDFIIIGRNIEESNEIKPLFTLVKILSGDDNENDINKIQKMRRLNDQ